MKKTEKVRAGPVLVLLAVLAACDLSTGPKTAAPIRVGAAVSLTGALSVEGTDTWSMQLVVESDGPDELRDTADDLEARL